MKSTPSQVRAGAGNFKSNETKMVYEKVPLRLRVRSGVSILKGIETKMVYG